VFTFFLAARHLIAEEESRNAAETEKERRVAEVCGYC
jgi:hypothetical protein